ncbi:MAG: hypothetical protein OEY49_11125, partial [Candidatus Heimdallarchaeota archaeon]|nr:hypothetical protein [Candidatus Heimdallarchaeota archaeon]
MTEKIPTPLLFQLIGHFSSRSIVANYRLFIPKGKIAKMQVVKNKLTQIPIDVSSDVDQIVKKALLHRIKSLPSLGRVKLDAELANNTIPFSKRSVSGSAMKTLIRGSRINLDEGS